MTAGLNHSCALTTDGQIWCWGVASNVGGGTPSTVPGAVQCYAGSTEYRIRTPVKVSSSLAFTDIDAGQNFSCALASSRQIYCWGRNFYGLAKEGHPEYTPTIINEPVD